MNKAFYPEYIKNPYKTNGRQTAQLKNSKRDLPVVQRQDSVLPMQGSQVGSLARISHATAKDGRSLVP